MCFMMNPNTGCLCLLVIDSSIICAADVNADYTIRPEPSDTLSLLRTLEAFDAAHG